MDAAVTIRGRDTASLLAYEAKRRPHLAALVERAHLLTDAEIDAADLPLAWMRKALRKLRDDAAKAAAYHQTATMMDLGGFIREGFSEDPTGEIRHYLGETVWVRSGASQIEVPYDKLLFFPHTGKIWVDTALCENDARLYHGSKLVEVATKTRYRQAIQEKLLRYHSDAPIIFSETAQPSAPGAGGPPPHLAALGVRFGR